MTDKPEVWISQSPWAIFTPAEDSALMTLERKIRNLEGLSLGNVMNRRKKQNKTEKTKVCLLNIPSTSLSQRRRECHCQREI